MNDEFSPALQDTDLDAARHDVERAEARLSSRWRAAKVAGEKSVGRAMSLARPVLIGAAVIGGIALIVSSLTRRGRGSSRRYSPTGPSLAADVARAAALALASTAARRLAERYLAVPTPSQSDLSGRRLETQGAG
jgi:hypothetical protein